MDGNVKIVRVDQMMLIGIFEMGTTLKAPRMLQFEPVQGGVKINLVKLVGDPESIQVTPAFSYAVADQGLIDAYREATTGLTMARSIPQGLGLVGGGRH